MSIILYKRRIKRFFLTFLLVQILSGGLVICIWELSKTKLPHGAVVIEFRFPFGHGIKTTILDLP